MTVLILKMSNAFLGCRNFNKKNVLLVVNAMVSFLWKSESSIGNSSSGIQFFPISNPSTTNSYLRLKLLVKDDWFTIRMYHLRYTQEFWNLFSDELTVVLKESLIVRNTEGKHLAYSYTRKPCIVFDVFSWRLYSWVSWMICHLVFESIFTTLLLCKVLIHQNIA